ncbi:MAG: tyrosine-type recombinase/integrase, partial [Candidatus Hodarchaeota archaeon]
GSAGLYNRSLLLKPSPIKIRNIDAVISNFKEYCIIDERMSKRCAKDYKNTVKRFLIASNGIVSRECVRQYLRSYLSMRPSTYNNQLKGLRAFIKRYLRRPDIVYGLKKAYETLNYDIKLPTLEQVRLGFFELSDDRERAIYLFYASTGLRRSEVLHLVKDNIDFHLRAVKPNHFTRTKKSGITFYNEECEVHLNRYLATREDNSNRVFRIPVEEFSLIWKKASRSAGFKITPQVLRKWFSTELGERLIPDRFIDIFQGRAPRTVLAKHYTGKELLRLKRIYDKADLRILS